MGLKRIGALALVVVLTLVVLGVMYFYAPVGAPAGYHFPHHAMFGSMDALYEGVLVEADGCVITETGDTVVWPPGYGIELRDGRLVVVGGGQVNGMGEPVALGGGFISRDNIGGYPLAAGSADVPCGDRFFLTSGWAN